MGVTALPQFRDIVSVRRCTVTWVMEIAACYMWESFSHPLPHVILLFFGGFQTSTTLSTYFMKTESACWDVRPDTCENVWISAVKDCLQFAVQWNTGDKFIHDRRGWVSCSSRFSDFYKLPCRELESLWAWNEPVNHVSQPLKHDGGAQWSSTQPIPEEPAAHRAEVLRQSLEAA